MEQGDEGVWRKTVDALASRPVPEALRRALVQQGVAAHAYDRSKEAIRGRLRRQMGQRSDEVTLASDIRTWPEHGAYERTKDDLVSARRLVEACARQWVEGYPESAGEVDRDRPTPVDPLAALEPEAHASGDERSTLLPATLDPSDVREALAAVPVDEHSVCPRHEVCGVAVRREAPNRFNVVRDLGRSESTGDMDHAVRAVCQEAPRVAEYYSAAPPQLTLGAGIGVSP